MKTITELAIEMCNRILEDLKKDIIYWDVKLSRLEARLRREEKRKASEVKEDTEVV